MSSLASSYVSARMLCTESSALIDRHRVIHRMLESLARMVQLTQASILWPWTEVEVPCEPDRPTHSCRDTANVGHDGT